MIMTTESDSSTKQILDTVTEHYLGKLFAFCLHEMQNRQDAEDLCQDIVVEIAYSARALRCREAISGWIWTIARRTLTRWWRRLRWEEAGIRSLEDERTVDKALPEEAVIAGQELNEVRYAIGLLSRHHREVIVLHYLREKSCAEIARSMNISESMVKYHLASARKRMKEGMEMVKERGVTSIDPGEFIPCWWGMKR